MRNPAAWTMSAALAINTALALARAPSGRKATESDVSFSCALDASSRQVNVTILNDASDKVYFERAGYPVDYEAVLTTADGHALPRAKPAGHNDLGARSFSIATIELLPGEKHVETVPLDELFAIPKQGGKFRLSLTRIVHVLENPETIGSCPRMLLSLPAH